MRRVMTACFWVCLACAVAGAGVSLLLIWGLATEYELNEVWRSVVTLFTASALTLVVGRIGFGGGRAARRVPADDQA